MIWFTILGLIGLARVASRGSIVRKWVSLRAYGRNCNITYPGS